MCNDTVKARGRYFFLHGGILGIRMFCVSLFLGVSVFASPAVMQQQGRGAVAGRVVDRDGNPVQHVAVQVEGTTRGAYSDERGAYRIANVVPGRRTLLIAQAGAAVQRVEIAVEPDGTVQAPDIVLDDSTELEEVSVTGKSESRRKQEQAFAISVLDVGKAHVLATPLSRLLNSVSSVRIRENGGVGSDYSFSLNGFSGNQVKFFLDGVPMDNFGSSFNLSSISTGMAERIEIYKGILPVSLGGDALGGAVNIVSRKEANYLDVSYSAGSFNTHRVAANGAYTDAKTGLTIRTSIFTNYSDNDYSVFVPVVDLNTNLKMDERWVKRFHDRYRSGGLKLEAGVTGRAYADYLLAGIIFSANDRDLQTGATMDAVYGGVQSESRSVIPSLRYKKSDLLTDGLALSAHGAYSSVHTRNVDTLDRKYNWLGEWVNVAQRGERYHTDAAIDNGEWLLNAGLDYRLGAYHLISLNNMFSSMKRKIFDAADPENESNKIPQHLSKDVTGLSWQTDLTRWNATVFGKMYHLQSASYKIMDRYTDKQRLEKIADDKTHFGYGAALTVFAFEGLQAKLSGEHAFRLPESTEMFGDGLIQQRNPDLKPESSDNLNVGLVFEQSVVHHSFTADVNFIYRNTKDFIRKDVSLTANPTTGYENLGHVVTKGVEGGIRYRWNGLLEAGANVTWQNIVDNQQFEENTGSYVGGGIIEHVTRGQRLPNIPYLFGHADVGLRFRNAGRDGAELTVDYACNYVHEYFLSFPGLGDKTYKNIIPEQLSHDLVAGYSFGNGRYGIALECTNLTGARLYDHYRLQKPGRTFNLKLRYFLR
jgi:outer membrane receptor protein involved in Fe transport